MLGKISYKQCHECLCGTNSFETFFSIFSKGQLLFTPTLRIFFTSLDYTSKQWRTLRGKMRSVAEGQLFSIKSHFMLRQKAETQDATSSMIN